MTQKTSSMTSMVKNSLKLGACGALIAAIGAAFIFFAPDEGGVKEAEATVVDFDLFAPHTNTQKFTRSLERLGHEKPRVFNYNGTHVFFSTRASSKEPKALIREYQEVFVQEGVNSKMWDVNPKLPKEPAAINLAAAKRAAAMLKGELQVVYHDDTHVVMSSALIDTSKPGAFTPKGVRPDGTPEVEADFSKIFQSHRHIDVEWHPVRQESVITASWSDEDFDIRKTQPSQYLDPNTKHLAPDPDVPPCLGCERLTRFAAASEIDRGFVKQIFSTSQTPQEVAWFYRSAMTQRGWKPTEAGRRLDALKKSQGLKEDPEEVTLQFEREGRFLTFVISPDDDETLISVMNSD